MHAPAPSELLDAALRYAAIGIAVFPCRPRGKEPMIEHGLHAASKDPEQIKAWWRQFPNANIGGVLGEASGIFALDIDGPEGRASIADLIEQHGLLPTSPTSITARGEHRLFKYDPRLRNSSGKLGVGLDIKTRNGYIVLPPSVHQSGAVYRWEIALGEVEVPCAPEWIFAELADEPEPPTAAPLADVIPIRTKADAEYHRAFCLSARDGEVRELSEAPKGGRNAAANLSAYKLGGYAANYPLHEVDVLPPLYRACVANGLVAEDGEARVWATLRSGWQSGLKHPRVIPEQRKAMASAPEAPKPVASNVDALFASWSTEGPLIHERTGLALLDEATGGGPVYGSRWYISGAPDACKTALQVQFAHEFALRGIAVGMLAVDEDASDLVTRFAQRHGFSRVQCERRLPADVERMKLAMANLPIHFFDARWTIETAARDLVAGTPGPHRVLMVDSTQTVRCDAELASRVEMSAPLAIEARVHAIRKVAAEHRMIVIATSEMSRAGYRSKLARDNIDAMAASKWSGAIEYSARVLLSLRSVPKEPHLIELEIAKNKHGPRREPIYLAIDRARQTLSESSYTPPTEDRDGAKVAQSSKQTELDAAALACVLARMSGVGMRDLRAACRTSRAMSHERLDAALLALGKAIVKVPGPHRAILHYLDGRRVPEVVLGLVPSEDRNAVIVSRPATIGGGGNG